MFPQANIFGTSSWLSARVRHIKLSVSAVPQSQQRVLASAVGARAVALSIHHLNFVQTMLWFKIYFTNKSNFFLTNSMSAARAAAPVGGRLLLFASTRRSLILLLLLMHISGGGHDAWGGLLCFLPSCCPLFYLLHSVEQDRIKRRSRPLPSQTQLRLAIVCEFAT